MKKLFLAICFSFLGLSIAQAKVTEVLKQSQIPQPQTQQPGSSEVKTLENDDFEDFLEERLQTVVVQKAQDVSTRSSSALPSAEALQAAAEAKKSTFQKIYESALQRVSSPEPNRADIETLAEPQTADPNWNAPGVPTIKVNLPPNGQPTMVPALEHIPYLMSNMEILPDGMMKISETIMVVADGKKLRNGLSRVLPQYVFSRRHEKQKLYYTLIRVTANGEEIPYRLAASKNDVWILPEQSHALTPGIYTYQFDYLVDNLLWDYGNFKELYWNITGGRWNLVVARAGATLSLPQGNSPLGQTLITGVPGLLSTTGTTIINPSPNVWGYAVNRPLWIGEGLHLVASLPEAISTPPAWDTKLLRNFDKYGDIIISALVLGFIVLSFGISWKYIRSNKGQLKIRLQKTPAMLRYLALSRYDLKSLGSFLLDLYRKNIIDIQQADDTILLIKRTDNLKSLNSSEQKALQELFTNNEPVLNVNRNNLLKIKRAAKALEKDARKSLAIFILKLNSGYLFFSLGMLIFGELGIALLGSNSRLIFGVLIISTLIMSGGIALLGKAAAGIWSKLLCKISGAAITAFAVVLMAAVISLPAIGLIAISLAAIKYYTTAYGQRRGLLKHYIDGIEDTKANLRKHRENILLGREIINQQPTIFALDMEAEFEPDTPSEYNKLSAMTAMLKTITRRS